jgi:hypothetical protein
MLTQILRNMKRDCAIGRSKMWALSPVRKKNMTIALL